MLSPDELGERLEKLLKFQPLGVLATAGSGQPHTSLIAFLASDDLRLLYFATSRATRKFQNLQESGRVALLVDDRSRSPSDFQQAAAVTAYGNAGELNGSQREAVAGAYLEKYPFLAEFVGASSCALMQVRVERYSLVTRFQEVADLEVEPWTWSSP